MRLLSSLNQRFRVIVAVFGSARLRLQLQPKLQINRYIKSKINLVCVTVNPDRSRAYPRFASSVCVGSMTASKRFLPPVPPYLCGQTPVIEVVKSIFDSLPTDPSCVCP